MNLLEQGSLLNEFQEFKEDYRQNFFQYLLKLFLMIICNPRCCFENPCEIFYKQQEH